MLSRRDKLLVQPWEERRFQDHRSKVRGAQPAIDARPPPARAHVTAKLKQRQREAERRRRIERDNRGLLQRLVAIMRGKRLDNCWRQPLPNLQQKVGMFYDAAALRGRVEARAAPAERDAGAARGVKCLACHNKRKTVLELDKVYGARAASPPSI